MRVGVLALQGDFREHIAAAQACGHDAIEVRTEAELNSIDALILPGGESTTIIHLAQTFNLFQPIKDRIRDGIAVYGSCAGMILLADRIIDGAKNQKTFGGLDITVRRNAFGRQVDSFESDIDFNGATLKAVFIRAPWVEENGKGVEVLSTAAGHPVAVRQGKILATSFHPELTADLAVHRYFFDEICKSG
ncbi:MAG: pyridoxal 5'-phosphate synthase glutaminase subunit PdxT [Actinobacteria bacterium]|nr:pyridoxal 5'-phosphate synthase glutaminase subunit PdxT [Actinomycetota bacterium]